jgi:uncharacterized protein (DUF4415 family)
MHSVMTTIYDSDAPGLDPEFWAQAEVREPAERKDNVSVRIDAAALDFIKGSDLKGYSRRVAKVLSACAHTLRSNHRPEIHADVQSASPTAN